MESLHTAVTEKKMYEYPERWLLWEKKEVFNDAIIC